MLYLTDSRLRLMNRLESLHELQRIVKRQIVVLKVLIEYLTLASTFSCQRSLTLHKQTTMVRL